MNKHMDITTQYLTRAEIWLVITTLLYFLMNGAQIFETAVIVPRWTAAAPESLQIFKGQYGLDFKVFWIVMHSIHEITFVLAIIFCWRLDPVRSWLLLLFVVHFAVRVWTLGYFAPHIIEFQKMANTGQFPAELVDKVNLWRILNYVRVAIFIAVSLGLIPVCIKVMSLRLS